MPQTGSLLFIATGSMDMNIRFLPPALLSAGPVSLGLLRPGVRYSFLYMQVRLNRKNLKA